MQSTQQPPECYLLSVYTYVLEVPAQRISSRAKDKSRVSGLETLHIQQRGCGLEVPFKLGRVRRLVVSNEYQIILNVSTR
jgi:hypothetical protein